MVGGTDPRLTEDHLRQIGDEQGGITILGVVHDHPSSIHRVRTLVAELDPDVLALELPPLAIPLFLEYADREVGPPGSGGEMSAAIRAAQSDRIVGIDGPSVGFGVALLRHLIEARASPRTVATVVNGLMSATRTAIMARVAYVLISTTSLHVELSPSVAHHLSSEADPSIQAADERRYIRRAQSIMDTLTPSRAVTYTDATRESYMAEQLARLQNHGSVVAVIGMGHLDPIAEALREGQNR